MDGTKLSDLIISNLQVEEIEEDDETTTQYTYTFQVLDTVKGPLDSTINNTEIYSQTGNKLSGNFDFGLPEVRYIITNDYINETITLATNTITITPTTTTTSLTATKKGDYTVQYTCTPDTKTYENLTNGAF